MPHRHNPYPGLTRTVDRHGKVRWRFRQRGKPSCYIHGEYGSKAFQAEYEAAINGTVPLPPSAKTFSHGSFSWLIVQYLRTPDFHKLSKIYKRNLSLELDWFRRNYGNGMIADLTPHHVERMIAKKAETPAAANKLLKLIRRLCRYAIRHGRITTDPTIGIKGYAMNPLGYHTWTDDEIAQFEDYHGENSKAVLALRIILFTGAARQDAAAMGWQNIAGERIEYRRHKTGGHVSIALRLVPDLFEMIKAVPRDQLLFLTHTYGRGYKPTSFGNWFKDQCKDAGLNHCSAHGLRKAGATRLANAGATEFEVMAFLGHKTPDEARTYVKTANRAKLNDSAMEKLRNATNPIERLDIHRSNSLKKKGE